MLEETEIYKMLYRVKTAPSEDLLWLNCFNTELKNKILNLIREDQLTKEGIDEAGKVIGYYSYLTELITKGRKQEGDPYNLKDTGSFYRSMFVIPLRDGIVIDANSATFDEMKKQEWYSDGILGLTDENLQKVIIDVQKKYEEQIAAIFYGAR